MKKALTLFCIAVTLFCNSLSAQFVYTNEDCNGARPLPATTNGEMLDSVFQKNTYCAVASSPATDCAGANAYYDLWYSFTAAQSTAMIKKSGSTIKVQLFSGTCASLTSMGCSTNLTGLTPGQQYFVRAYQNSNVVGDTSEFKLNLLNPLTNDDCNNASLVTVAPGNNPLSYLKKYANDGATPSGTTCATTTGWTTMNDIWFKFVATNARHSVFYRCPTTTKTICYSGTPGSFTQVGSFNVAFGLTEGVMELINLTPGQTYYLRTGSTAASEFSFVIASPPANDECANADTALMSTSYNCDVTFITDRLGATNSTTPCTAINKDVWNIFKATSPDIVVRAFGDVTGIRLQLLDGSCGSLSCLAYSTNDHLTYSGLTVGNYYYLRSGNVYNPVQICICPYINNDDCAGAITLPVNPYGSIFSNYGYNAGATSSLPKCTSAQITHDVWYKFTAIDTVCLINAYYETGSSTYEVFTGTCGSLNSIFCSNTTTGKKVGGLTIGTVYYVRTYDNLGQGLFTFDITSLPSNDECTGATLLAIQPDLFYNQIYNNGIADATTSVAPCSATSATKDIWYSFTPTQTSATIISHALTTFLSTDDINFQFYSGTCGSLTSIACVTQSVQHQVITLNNLIANQTYFIRQYGIYTRNVMTIVNHPANDKITGAIALPALPANVSTLNSFTTHGATVDFGKICSSSSQPFHDVWFYFIVNASAQTITIGNYDKYWNTNVASLLYKLETFNGFANDSLSLAAKLISCGNNSLSLTGLTFGDTIYIRLFDFSNASTTTIFSINIINSQSIDEPTGALQLQANNLLEYQINTSGATQTLPYSGCIIDDYPDDDVWFKFTAAANAKRVIAGFETKDVTLQLFSGTPGSLTAIKCSNNILLLPTNLTNGTVYYVRAYSKANAQASQFAIGLYDESDGATNNCITTNCVGPNLVSNPKCESTYDYLIPDNDGNIIQGKLVEGWWNATLKTSDRWNADYPAGILGNVLGTTLDDAYSKNVVPRDGKGMLGMLYESSPDWSEYVSGKLNAPMIVGKEYIVSFYVMMSSHFQNDECDNIGAYLSTDSLLTASDNRIELKPHISNPPNQRITNTKTWTNICGTVIATQPYQYITIGNFGPKQLSNNLTGYTYFFIDEVLVAENGCSTIGIEEHSENNKSKLQLDAFPNPAKDYLNVRWSNSSNENVELFIYDISARLVWQSGLVKSGLTETQIETKHFQPGFYSVALHGKQVSAVAKFVVVR